MQAMAKKRTGSRHKDRNTVSLPGAIYGLMKALAERERRPLSTQLVIACEEHLRARGVALPTEQPAEEDEDGEEGAGE